MKVSLWVVTLLIGVIGGYFLGKTTVDCEYEIYKTQKEIGQNPNETSTATKEGSTETIILPETKSDDHSSVNSSGDIPQRAYEVLSHIRKHGTAPEGVQGGRKFFNREGLLPKNESYQEWDIHVKVPGKNRGAERIVTSPTKAYYTRDHYRSFIIIEE